MAILEATARVFAERGYDHLSIERIAGEAGVAKQTIYRWWPSKGALVAECLLEGMLLPAQLVPRDTGDLSKDLAAWLDEVFALLGGAAGEKLFRSLIAAAAQNADVAGRLREKLGVGSSLTERFERAVAAGQLSATAPLQEVSEALVGAVIVRALIRAPREPGDQRRIIDAVIGANRP